MKKTVSSMLVLLCYASSINAMEHPAAFVPTSSSPEYLVTTPLAQQLKEHGWTVEPVTDKKRKVVASDWSSVCLGSCGTVVDVQDATTVVPSRFQAPEYFAPSHDLPDDVGMVTYKSPEYTLVLNDYPYAINIAFYATVEGDALVFPYQQAWTRMGPGFQEVTKRGVPRNFEALQSCIKALASAVDASSSSALEQTILSAILDPLCVLLTPAPFPTENDMQTPFAQLLKEHDWRLFLLYRCCMKQGAEVCIEKVITRIIYRSPSYVVSMLEGDMHAIFEVKLQEDGSIACADEKAWSGYDPKRCTYPHNAVKKVEDLAILLTAFQLTDIALKLWEKQIKELFLAGPH